MARRLRKPRPFLHDPLWYKDAVIYQLHVKSFFDANNDGIGDFPGLIEKLDYIADLGVNTLWLLPFYPSPRRDDGYDIAMYRGVHPDYGSLADVRRFIAAAHARNLRVITELVINHTSDQHPWFQRARRAKKGSRAREWYVWSDSDERYAGTRIIFVDSETSNWTWDPLAGQYYWHRFYSHQPDLNFDNPQVLRAVLGVMRFWLDLGVDGLRLDAIPYLIEREGTSSENLPETHAVLKRIRAELDAHYPDRMLLAEANQWPEDTRPYFGGMDDGGPGDECHMAFHFPLMPRMYMAIAQEDRFPISDILRQTPAIPDNCQWAIFLRNHDELTLEMVTDDERDYLWNYYAADRRARINLGIRRRLAPLVERDRRRIELLNSLLLSMPGTPTLYYGDEIGMGDNIYLGDRDGVRTPMQWSVDRNGGFSRADPASLVLPAILDPLYGYQSVNVEAQLRDPHSLLNWTRRMLAVRKQQKAFGRGSMTLLSPSNRRILAYLRQYRGEEGEDSLLCVANLSGAAQAVELELAEFDGRVPLEMLGGAAFPPIGRLTYLLTLPPYGFYWFYLADSQRMPTWHRQPEERLPELPTLVLGQRLEEIMAGAPRELLEKDSLPRYLPRRRWFPHARAQAGSVRLLYALPLEEDDAAPLLAELEYRDGELHERYQLPLAAAPEKSSSGYDLPQQLALARLRRGRRVGLLTDALSLPRFSRVVLRLLRENATLAGDGGEVQFLPQPGLAELELAEDIPVRVLAADQSNTSALVGDGLLLKVLRRVSPGLHPEAEMGAYLSRHGFANVAPLLGEVRRVDEQGQTHTLMLLQGYLSNQGDAWTWTQNNLERAIREALAAGTAQPPEFDALDELRGFAATLGRRLGEMHQVLADGADEPDFAPRRSAPADSRAWQEGVGAQVEQALRALDDAPGLDERGRAQAARLLELRDELLLAVGNLARLAEGGLMIRVHGDLHLGQVLVVQEDAYLIDFEGEPNRSLAERRALNSPMKDVAGVLRSFDYAAAMAERSLQSADVSEEAVRVRRAVAQRYRADARDAFLDAYRLAAAGLPHEWRGREGEGAALALFSLEKAAYEVVYESGHRPDWVAVPLQGMLELTLHLLGGRT
ncbi:MULTISPECIES: maltose alpha-D-glucosyltransferase [unclassified Pseudomonas]|uniref:maltose alpha-D-glucosyltransferase n=1 Tax=unclassified Pseudomonas TaxID=196821 RepID=UPI0002A32E6F|nr:MULTISPECIES: maltose alpha-D-glucosyltransferase [unclassified Pseudomonas]MBB1609095.1 trehalose synthase [Pseudomonas sp. UMC76]MBB1640173.1 trehalose synthase [Pseudomonas sp. UME83]NTX92379.1 maltose alpha-D-glucosyltransferase [Pseudomonas sp. UMA643]NTY22343.1 maltose alpha-D-glucosyltransferase [Pseudomonas sp. UMC3103]NTY28174.1 maltose alpha-D-glucosyltransferase [Pseudomonas sp. UMA603]